MRPVVNRRVGAAVSTTRARGGSMSFTVQALITFVFLAVSAPAYTQDFTWKGTISKGRFLEIKGVHGNINAERTGGKDVEVAAIKHASRSDPSHVRFEKVETDAGITICA